MQSALVSLSTLERQRAQTENALVILIGGKQIKDLPPPHDLSEDDILQDIPVFLRICWQTGRISDSMNSF